jgi:hypothetical protein
MNSRNKRVSTHVSTETYRKRPSDDRIHVSICPTRQRKQSFVATIVYLSKIDCRLSLNQRDVYYDQRNTRYHDYARDSTWIGLDQDQWKLGSLGT